MTVQTNLSSAIDAYIQNTFAGTLDEISASKINLEKLLRIQQALTSASGGGGGSSSITSNTSIEYGAGATTAKTTRVAIANDANAVITLGTPDLRSLTTTLNSATLNATFVLQNPNGGSTASFVVSGLTASGATLAVEASDNNNTSYLSVNGITAVTGAAFQTFTTDRAFRVNVAGRNQVQVKVSAIGTGNISVTGTISNGVGTVALLPTPQLPPALGINTAVNSFPVVIASDSVLQPATNFTASTVCLTTALVEGSIALTSAKKLAIYSRTNTTFRISTTSSNTINTQNFETILSSNEYYQDGINFTGNFFFSAEILPTPITVLACATTNASANITSANSFSSAVIGQAVTGTGIPANTFIIRRAADGLSITLGDANGATVNATSTSSATLTFSGAVIRISRWT